MSNLLHEVRSTFNRDALDTVIFFVTSACNFKCRFCCYADNLNQGRDFKIADIEKMSASMGPFRSLLVSGGEPFLKKNLADILLLFVRNNDVRTISIPSNGWYTDRITAVVESFYAQVEDVGLSVSVSLEGMADISDRVRGMPGGFERAMQTLAELGRLRARFPRLRARVNSVLVDDNADSIAALIEHVHASFPFVDEFSVEIERDISTAVSDYPAKAGLTDDLLRLNARSVELFEGREGARTRRDVGIPVGLARRINAAMVDEVVRVKVRRIEGELWPFACTAGRTIIVINSEGELAPCELRAEKLKLADYDFDVAAAMRSEAWQSARRRIREERCDCTHGCFVGNSLRHSGAHFLRQVPLQGAMKAVRG